MPSIRKYRNGYTSVECFIEAWQKEFEPAPFDPSRADH